MGTDGQHHGGCLFPFGDDFLPTLMFFLNVNDYRDGVYSIEEVDPESQDQEDQDQDESNLDDEFDPEDDSDSDDD